MQGRLNCSLSSLDYVRKEELERQGFEVTCLEVEEDGLLDLNKFKAALRPDTIVALVMLVNTNSAGCRTSRRSARCRANGTVFHVDAAQATGNSTSTCATCPSIP